MKITIEAEHKEIADLVVTLQGQPISIDDAIAESAYGLHGNGSKTADGFAGNGSCFRTDTKIHYGK